MKSKLKIQESIEDESNSEEIKDILSNFQILNNLKRKRPILLLGETGTGKTTLARQYHAMTGLPEKKFFHVLCGSFAGADLNTVNSRLFGHIKGAFTGANEEKIGVIEEADGGVLFLDEIGDIPIDTQRLLIDVIESSRFTKFQSSIVQESHFN